MQKGEGERVRRGSACAVCALWAYLLVDGGATSSTLSGVLILVQNARH